ncbi:MAG: hypothetical protein KDN05_00670 [Verrucomicrobiae bacterium]|nr:hypothetical protein [Verrucomicrobiae bacterium]
MKTKTNETAPALEAFLHLISANAVAEDLALVISADYLRMRHETAMAMKTGDLTLAAKEHERFMENCRIIKAVTVGEELRNYLLWEVKSTEQFRETDQDFVAFGKRLTGLGKSQLNKCVHAGRIRIEMIHAGLDHVRPTGRQVEELSRVEDSHTVTAWIYALEYMRVNGRSDATASEALREYCKIQGIQFGRRKPNGSRKLNLPKISRKAKAAKGRKRAPTDDDEWDLSPHEEELILSIDAVSDDPKCPLSREEKLSRAIAALKSVGQMPSLSDYEATQFEGLLALVARKDGETTRSLLLVAWKLLRELLTKEASKAPTSPRLSSGEETGEQAKSP